MAKLTVPVIVTVVGEGGSGGALAIAVGNRVNMLENSVYSVITPEGCASILWRDAARAPEAAQAMKVAAPDLKALGLIDDIIEEPPGGAHSDHDATFVAVRAALDRQLAELSGKSVKELLDERYDKFRAMGRIGQDLVEG